MRVALLMLRWLFREVWCFAILFCNYQKGVLGSSYAQIEIKALWEKA